MRLFEAILDANHRALAGDANAGLRPAEHADALPVVVLTCIDPRLNPLMPAALGVPEDQFIWLRNAGNIIFDSLSSMTRTLALACAVKGGREIAVIGHTDCRVRQTPVMELIERFQALGVPRARLPDNLTEFFGLFASERQNVIRGVGFVRASPLIGPRVPVHGLIVDIETGRLDWVVNGYEALNQPHGAGLSVNAPLGPAGEPFAALPELAASELRFAAQAMGEIPATLQPWLEQVDIVPPSLPGGPMEEPPPLPLPPPVPPQRPRR